MKRIKNYVNFQKKMLFQEPFPKKIYKLMP